MTELNEINSTFYAMRLLAHDLDLSAIEVTEGDEYPATEFTPAEQGRALEIARDLKEAPQVSFMEQAQGNTEPLWVQLADQIEELTTRELAGAGYDVATSTEIIDFTNETLIVEAVNATPPEFSPRQREILRLIVEGRSTEDIAQLLDVSINTVRTEQQKLGTKMKNLDRTTRQVGID